MTAVTSWWWVRHAPVTSHGGRIYGNQDVPADCSELALFDWLGEHLPADAVWVTSHLSRTRQTADAIVAAGRTMDGELLVERDLAEQNFGEWQGLTHEELRQQRSAPWHRFWLSPAEETPPGGESFAQVVDRVSATVGRLTQDHKGRDIVAIAHGGSIRAALAIALGVTPEQALSFSIANCSLTRLDLVEGPDTSAWRIVCVNRLPAGGQ